MSWEDVKTGFDTVVMRLSALLGIVFFSVLIFLLGFVAMACLALAVVKYG